MNTPRPGQHIRLVEIYVKSGTVVTYVGRVYGAGSDVVEFDGGVMAYFTDYISSADGAVSIAATWEAEPEPLPTTPGSVIRRPDGKLLMLASRIYAHPWVGMDGDGEGDTYRLTQGDTYGPYEIVFDAGAAT